MSLLPGKLAVSPRALDGDGRPGQAGWLAAARHDAGLVSWLHGVLVAVIMQPAGVGHDSDVPAGCVALATLRFFRAVRG